MSNDKEAAQGGRLIFQSEIFQDRPTPGANYASSIGAEQGIELLRQGAYLSPATEARLQPASAAE